MPARNGRGPLGQGPRTGYARGRCVNVAAQMEPQQEEAGFGLGRGNQHRRGRRHRHWFYWTGLTGSQRTQKSWTGPDLVSPTAPSEQQEIAALKQQAQSLEQALGKLMLRIHELGKSKPDITAMERV